MFDLSQLGRSDLLEFLTRESKVKGNIAKAIRPVEENVAFYILIFIIQYVLR